MVKEFDLSQYNGETLILYGAGHDGKIIANGLKRASINDFIFCDKKLQGGGGKCIIPPNELHKFTRSQIIIASGKYCIEIYEYLKEMNFNDDNIFTGAKLYELGFEDRSSTDFEILTAIFAYATDIKRLTSYQNDGWYLHHLNIYVTEKCTLKCKSCCNLVQFYEKPQNDDEGVVLSSFQNFLDAGGYVGAIDLLGGEPFINQKLMRTILSKYKSHTQIGSFYTISNGTIVPEKETLEIMAESPIFVLFSNYGSLSHKQDEAKRALQDYNIPVCVLQEKDINKENNSLWRDYGEVKHYDFPEAKHQKNFDTCLDSRECVSMKNGKLFLCPRIAHGVHLGLIPDNSYRCSMDFTKPYEDKKECKQLFEEFYYGKKYPAPCEYCNRDAGILVKRAEQMLSAK